MPNRILNHYRPLEVPMVIMKLAFSRPAWFVVALSFVSACSSSKDDANGGGGASGTGTGGVPAGEGGSVAAGKDQGGAGASLAGRAGASGASSGASGAGAVTAGSGGKAGTGGDSSSDEAGAGGAPMATGGAPSTEVPSGYVPGIVAVGYGGLRVVSRDDGKTWGDAVAFGKENEDDDNLLRAVVYGKGRWIATGWRLISSDDGVTWTEHGMVRDAIEDQRIIEGLAYANGYFYAAGDPGKLYRSSDGLEWERYGASIGNTEKHTTLAYRGGLFVAYGDSRSSFQSEDGSKWAPLAINEATYCGGEWKTLEACNDAAWFEEGFYLREQWGGKIQRSTDGARFDTVYTDPDQHTVYKSFAFARGYVKP